MEFEKVGLLLIFIFFSHWHQVFSVTMKPASETTLVSVHSREVLDV